MFYNRGVYREVWEMWHNFEEKAILLMWFLGMLIIKFMYWNL